MNILAIETATPSCALGLRTDSGGELTVLVDEELHHTETLTPGIQGLLLQLHLTARSIDRVVVDRGPGLFTGLRVGIATAVGLALATGADLVTVTSLELLAHGAKTLGVTGTVVAGVDGRRGELFVQSFQLDDEVRAVSEPTVVTPDQLVDAWRDHEPFSFTGDGVARYEEQLAVLDQATFADQLVPSPSEALSLGATREPVAEVVPLYLREADAIANFATRARRP